MPLDGKAKTPYLVTDGSDSTGLGMAITLTVTAKGQITLRKEVLNHLGIRPGDKLSVDLLNDHRVQLRPQQRNPASTIFGMLEHASTKRLSIEEIGKATAAGWAGEE